MNIKKEVKIALQEDDFSKVEVCFNENEVATSRYLQMHVYGMTHEVTRWRAIEYIGKLAGLYSAKFPELFRNVIRRFLWQMCEESANVPWASGEVIGSIIANVDGPRYNEFFGPWMYHVSLNDICYAGFLWSMPQMMKYHADKVEEFLPDTIVWFDDFDMPDMRGYASIYFEQFVTPGFESFLKEWSNDDRVATLYIDRQVQEVKVSSLAKKALANY